MPYKNFQMKVMHTLHANPQMRFFLTFPMELLLHPVDIFHATFTVPFLPNRLRPKIVLTVPEIPWFTDPESFPGSSIFSAQMRLAVRYSISKANRIMTQTHFMKKQLTSYFDLSERKIEVIPWGVDEAYFERLSEARIKTVTNRLSITRPYILCVGDLHPRKNQIALIRAYTKLREQHNIPHYLVLVGRPLYKAHEVYASADSTSSRNRIKLPGYVDSEDLRALYQGASLFVFPSLHEGFGLPVHEAMASGIPVVTSTRDALPEVAGDAALLVDPLDIESIASSVLRVIEDISLRNRLTEKGLAQARRFSWQDSGRKVVATYQQVYCEGAESAA
jgi:glycosyltransferase involved in cell wall biosynthesis